MFSKSDSVQKNNPLNANNAIRFIIDFRNADGSQDTLQDYINREPDYDLAFCKTWQTVFGELENKKLIHDFLFEKTDDRTPSKKIEFLVNYLELIQENSLQHRENFKEGPKGIMLIKGRAALNWFGINKGHTANEKGIEHLVNAILSGEKNGFNSLHINTDNPKDCFFVDETGLFTVINQKVFKMDCSKKQIIDFVIVEYNKGFCANKNQRLVLKSVKGIDERITQERKLFEIFLKKMQQADTEQAKIETIATTIQDIMQLHIYYDGNGRSLFIFANWLFWLLDIPLFYPSNMCIFDANSLEKMSSEITEGQVRFRTMFTDEVSLTSALKTYEESILELINIINNSPLPEKMRETLNTSLKKRDLNLLFRQSAAKTDAIAILKWLLEYKDILNITIHQKGLKSGKDAMDVAKENQNDLAREALSDHWPSEPIYGFSI